MKTIAILSLTNALLFLGPRAATAFEKYQLPGKLVVVGKYIENAVEVSLVLNDKGEPAIVESYNFSFNDFGKTTLSHKVYYAPQLVDLTVIAEDSRLETVSFDKDGGAIQVMFEDKLIDIQDKTADEGLRIQTHYRLVESKNTKTGDLSYRLLVLAKGESVKETVRLVYPMELRKSKP